jgi:hypothetical protein
MGRMVDIVEASLAVLLLYLLCFPYAFPTLALTAW